MPIDKTVDKKKHDKESNITKHDKNVLGNKHENLRRDGGNDQQLIDRERPVDFEGKDLDIHGRTLPEDRDKKDLSDEENQLYSEND